MADPVLDTRSPPPPPPGGAFGALREAAIRGHFARNWWLLALRGLLAIGFGIVAFLVPTAAILSILFVFVAYALVDGAMSIFAAVRAARDSRPWKSLAVEGATSLLFAGLAILWPGLTVVVFILLVAGWAILSGAMMLRSAYALGPAEGRGWLAFSGLASIVFGLLLVAAPMLGILVVTWWIAAFAILLGVSLIVLAFKLRGADMSVAGGVARGP